MDPILILVALVGAVLCFSAGFLVAAHNAKQAAATQTAIAAVHKDVAEVKGALTAFAAPADPPKS